MNATEDAGRRPIRRALVSVYDKTGLAELARALHEAGVEIVSTGSTASTISGAGVPVTPVEQVTGFPEILDGRVKTLHPKIHGGLLADLRKDAHAAQLDEHGIAGIDLLVSNLYPFQATVASGADTDECVEQIDIGGPAMVRAAAKNHASVAVVTDPAAYPAVLAALADGGFTVAQRRALAARAFADIADYDVAVADWFATTVAPAEDGWPQFAGLALRRQAVLRYGENPHQAAALYTDPGAPAGLAQAEQLHGKEMSYNNYVDADAAWRAANDFPDEPAVAIIKHANPCGIAVGADVAEAHRKAHACDPVSAFGGVIAVNRPVSVELAGQVAEIFTEVLVAPGFDEGALEVLRAKKNIRLLRAPAVRHPAGGVAAGQRRRAGADAGRRRRARRRPVRLDAGHRRPGRRGDAARPGVRLAGGPRGQEQRDPAGPRRRHRRRRHGSGQPGGLGAAGGQPGR